MASHTSSFSSNGYIKYMYSGNGNETQKYSLDSPITIPTGYKIDSVIADFYNFFKMSAGKSQQIKLTLLLNSTQLKSSTFTMPGPTSTDLLDFSYSVTSISSSTSDELITTIDHIDIKNESDEYAITQSSNGYGSVTINYSQKPVKPNAPSLQIYTTNVAPETEVKLLWSDNGYGTASSVTYYIYKNGTQIDTTTKLYYYAKSSTINNTTDTYTVKSYGDDTKLFSDASNEVTLTTKWTNPSKPASIGFKVGTSTTATTPVYIGTSDAPNLILDWGDSTDGTNNTLKSYTVFLDSSFLQTGLTSSEYTLTSKTAGTYTVQAIGTYSNSSVSSGAVLGIISAPNKPTITTNFTKVSSDPTFQWNSVTAVNNASLIYQVRYTINGTTSSWINNGTSTSYTLKLDSVGITENTPFTFSVRVRAQATNGGYTYSDITTTNTITRAAALIYPTTLWTQCYGVTSSGAALQTVGMYPYGYNYCKLGWNAISSSTGNSITYTVNYKIGVNDSWKSIATTTSTSTIINLSQIAEGSQIIFQLMANDGTTTGSDARTYTYTKLIKPTISNLSIVNVNKTTIQPKFTWDNGDNSNSSLVYEVYLGYNNKEALYRTDTYAYSDTKTWQESLLINLASGASSSSNEMIKALYNAVNGDIANNVLGLAKPEGYIKIVMYNSIFTDCKNSLTKNFTYNFSTTDLTPPSPDSFSIANNAQWVNPNTNFTYKFGSASWTDALGNSNNQIGGKVQYIITGNNKTVTSYSSNTDINDIVLTATSDLYLTYTLTTKVLYQDYTVTATKTISDSIYIARWSSVDNISLANVIQENGKISGELILPAYLCGSEKFPSANVSSVNYAIYNSDDPTVVLWSGSLNFDEITNFKVNISIPFNFDNDIENISLFGKAIFTNTNNDIVEKTSASYLLRGIGVPLAIRKGRIGINVDSSFNKENDTRANSALYIAASSDTAPILELSAGSNATNPVFINFLEGNTLFGNIYYNETQSLFHCDKWYYPVTSVNGQTGAITLSASDINARPSTWMPTAGDGISISGETISNSGIRTLTATTGDNNGQIKLTINGTSTNVSVKGFSTNYLPLSGGNLSGKITTSYESGTWINSANGGSAINLTGTSYTGWISGNSKTGKFVISTYPAQTDLLYFGFKLNTTITSGINSLDKSMTWNGTTGELKIESATISGAVSANVINGNAIIYTDNGTTPTGTVRGQIWLKKKGT